MSTKTGIAWTDATWNPIRGCSRVSEGCRNCYAERTAIRQAWRDDGLDGATAPYAGLVKSTPSGPRWTGEVRFVEEALTLPLKWRAPRRVFVNSMSDLFHEKVPVEWIDRIFAVMAQAERHVFQVLTKRPERMLAYMRGRDWSDAVNALIDKPMHHTGEIVPPLPNVWLGVSVENQAAADERIPLLLQTPAAVRLLSVEPLLGPVDLDGGVYDGPGWLRGWHTEPEHDRRCDGSCSAGRCPVPTQTQNERVDWVIVGGESGPGHRPMDIKWLDSLTMQCNRARVPLFVKQDSGPRPGQQGRIPDHLWTQELPKRAGVSA